MVWLKAPAGEDQGKKVSEYPKKVFKFVRMQSLSRVTPSCEQLPADIADAGTEHEELGIVDMSSLSLISSK